MAGAGSPLGGWLAHEGVLGWGLQRKVSCPEVGPHCLLEGAKGVKPQGWGRHHWARRGPTQLGSTRGWGLPRQIGTACGDREIGKWG